MSIDMVTIVESMGRLAEAVKSKMGKDDGLDERLQEILIELDRRVEDSITEMEDEEVPDVVPEAEENDVENDDPEDYVRSYCQRKRELEERRVMVGESLKSQEMQRGGWVWDSDKQMWTFG